MLLLCLWSCLIGGVTEELALLEIFSDARTKFFSHEEDDFLSKMWASQLINSEAVRVGKLPTGGFGS